LAFGVTLPRKAQLMVGHPKIQLTKHRPNGDQSKPVPSTGKRMKLDQVHVVALPDGSAE
jgi:hypothetical protein